MISSRHIEKIVISLLCVAMVFCCLLTVYTPGSDSVRVVKEYESMLFDTSHPADINIIMDDDKWAEMLDSAYQKDWYSCDVIINGTRFYNVGIRTKGANSLESIAEDPDSNRYSFKLKFDKYDEDQKCWGLDSLCLNNNFGDISSMKEALIYDMFHFLGSDASLCNYAAINVNGNYWGVYLAIEPVDSSFLQRNYNGQSGALYNPGNAGGSEDSDEMWEMMEDMEDLEEDSFIGSGGSNLNYIDDNVDSYWCIWSSQITKTDDSDHRRVVEALRHISEQDSLEDYMDVDNVLRYMAVHNFCVNLDSLYGDGDHNYYLYEQDGKLNIIPWDYNLSFGAYQVDPDPDSGGYEDELMTSSDVVNFPIDDHWSMTTFFDGLLDNDEYRAKYHEYYRMLVDEYVFGGRFDVFYTKTRSRIDELVRTDPNALYSYEAYDNAAKMLKATVEARGLSVRGQLDGTIPSTREGQMLHPGSLVGADEIDILDLGADMLDPTIEYIPEEESWELMIAQQKQIKSDNIRKSAVEYCVSFVVVILMVYAIKKYERRKLNISR